MTQDDKLRDCLKEECRECSQWLDYCKDKIWHTETPTEDGLYIVYYWDDHNPSATPYEVLYDGFLSPDGEGNWIDRDGEIRFIDDDIVRWQRIEPYKEEEK